MDRKWIGVDGGTNLGCRERLVVPVLNVIAVNLREAVSIHTAAVVGEVVVLGVLHRLVGHPRESPTGFRYHVGSPHRCISSKRRRARQPQHKLRECNLLCAVECSLPSLHCASKCVSTNRANFRRTGDFWHIGSVLHRLRSVGPLLGLVDCNRSRCIVSSGSGIPSKLQRLQR